MPEITFSSSKSNRRERVEVVERMGHETMVYFTLDDNQQVARLAADAPYRPGAALPLHLRPDSWHLYADDETGMRLNWPKQRRQPPLPVPT